MNKMKYFQINTINTFTHSLKQSNNQCIISKSFICQAILLKAQPILLDPENEKKGNVEDGI